MWLLALLGRLPLVAFVAAVLFGGAWYLQATGTPTSEVQDFFGGKVAIGLDLFVRLLPTAAVFTALLGVAYLVLHQTEHAVRAAVSAAIIAVVAIAWHLGVGLWVTAHLTGAA